MKYRRQIISAILIILLLAVAYIWMQRGNMEPLNAVGNNNATVGAGGSSTPAAQVQASLVVVRPVTQSVINNRLTAIGTGRANATVALKPWTAGNMVALYVSAGAKVKAGDPIAQLDSDNEKIAVEKARVNLNDAKLALDRTTQLRKTNTATEVQALNAKLVLETAKLALQDTELKLERRTVRAPISGVIGILPVDVGNYVTTDTTIARIDDRSLIQVDIWVPERFAPLIHIGDKIEAASIARPGENYEGAVSAIDNMIDEESRTLRIRAQIDNQKDQLRAGQSFRVMLTFPGDPFPTVDPLAIQWSGKGAYVWRVVGDKVQAVPVYIVQRNTNSVLVNAELKAGDLVVIQGLQSLRDGSAIKIKNATNADVAATLPKDPAEQGQNP